MNIEYRGRIGRAGRNLPAEGPALGASSMWDHVTDYISSLRSDATGLKFTRKDISPSLSVTTMTTSLDLLKQTGTTVVSDSGDFECQFPFHFCIQHPLIVSMQPSMSTSHKLVISEWVYLAVLVTCVS